MKNRRVVAQIVGTDFITIARPDGVRVYYALSFSSQNRVLRIAGTADKIETFVNSLPIRKSVTVILTFYKGGS